MKILKILTLVAIYLSLVVESRAQHFIIDNQVEKELNNGMFLGCVVVAGKPNQVLFNKAYGYRDTGLPMDTSTMFDVASITKVAATSTALAILMTDSSSMSIDDRAAQYLSGLNGEGGDEMTIAHLGTHTSGLGDSFLKEYTGEELIDKLLARDISWPIDTKYKYSNNGTVRLSELVGEHSGMSFGTFCDQRIYKPMGMARTMFGNLPDEYRSNCVKTQRRKIGNMSNQIAWRATERNPNATSPVGCAGLFTTGTDLAKFSTLWLQKGEYKGKRYFSEDIYNTFTKKQSDYGNKGILWMIGYRPEGMSKKTFSHTGYTGQSLWIDPVNQWYVIVLTTWFHNDITAGNAQRDRTRERIGAKAVEYLKYKEDSIKYAGSTFNIEFKVLDNNSSTPVKDASINFNDSVYQTDSSGEINIPTATFGYYDVTIEQTGYFPFQKAHLKVYSDTTFQFMIQEDLPDVQFEIKDKSSKDPIYRALINLGDKSIPSAHDGTGEIENVTEGIQPIKVDHEEYFPFHDTIQVLKDTTLYVNLTRKWANVHIQVLSGQSPIGNLMVNINSSSASTGTDGTTTFYNLNARCSYVISIDDGNYEPLTDTLFLETDTTLMVNLTAKTTGSGEDGKDPEFSLYPNPAKDNIILCAPQLNVQPIIEIFDLSGKKLFQTTMKSRQLEINTLPFEPGKYVLKISYDNHQNCTKILSIL